MAAWQIFKVSRKTFFNPSAWLNIDEIRGGNRAIWEGLTGLFTTETPVRTETFEEAMLRLGLTEENIHQTEQNYYAFSWFFLILSVLVFIFSFFLLFYHRTLAGWVIGIPASGLFLVQAFRYNFWYFQIKNRKLGCTIKEWWQGRIESREKTP